MEYILLLGLINFYILMFFHIKEVMNQVIDLRGLLFAKFLNFGG